jgi:hypothetical protein
MSDSSLDQKASWHLHADLQNAIARVTLEQASIRDFEEVRAIAQLRAGETTQAKMEIQRQIAALVLVLAML